jgi:hypothetical protein
VVRAAIPFRAIPQASANSLAGSDSNIAIKTFLPASTNSNKLSLVKNLNPALSVEFMQEMKYWRGQKELPTCQTSSTLNWEIGQDLVL